MHYVPLLKAYKPMPLQKDYIYKVTILSQKKIPSIIFECKRVMEV